MPDHDLPPPARQAIDLFSQAFPDAPGPALAAWAPGRINLIGEHTDYNDGWVLPIASDRVVALAARARPDRQVRLYAAHYKATCIFALDPGRMPDATAPPHWALYPLGVCFQLARAGYTIQGFDAVIAGDVPLGSGMSSSAALEVATAQTVMALQGFSIAPLDLARLCQRAEQETTGVQCGIMDQATACLGRAGFAIMLDCRSLAYTYIPFNLPDTVLVVCDSAVRRELAGSAYNTRRRECTEATALLAQATGRSSQITALRDITPKEFERHQHALPDVLRRRARHVISENARVHAAAAALRAGDAQRLGDLLCASHSSLRNDYEVSSPELDMLVELAMAVSGVWGARMMGGGFGGSIIALVKREAVPALIAAITRHYPTRTGRQATLAIAQVGDGPQARSPVIQGKPSSPPDGTA